MRKLSPMQQLFTRIIKLLLKGPVISFLGVSGARETVFHLFKDFCEFLISSHLLRSGCQTFIRFPPPPTPART